MPPMRFTVALTSLILLSFAWGFWCTSENICICFYSQYKAHQKSHNNLCTHFQLQWKPEDTVILYSLLKKLGGKCFDWKSSYILGPTLFFSYNMEIFPLSNMKCYMTYGNLGLKLSALSSRTLILYLRKKKIIRFLPWGFSVTQ